MDRGYVLEDFVELDLPARLVNTLFDYLADYSRAGGTRAAAEPF